jgi:hypothetical protein
MVFQRFAAATAVASTAIALATIVVLLTPRPVFERIHPITILWCFVPFVWGLWALITPSPWMPARLPLWGAILGLIGGFLGVFVLNLPARFFAGELPLLARAAAVLAVAVFYYALWIVVRAAYRLLPVVPERRE